MPDNREVQATGRPRRIVNMSLSLEWVIGVLGAGLLAATTIWFNVQQLNKNVSELTIAVTSGNTAYNVINGKMTLLEWRVDLQEKQLKAVKEKADK